jgi:hypothetical protein
MAMTAHRIVVTVGHGENTASAGAKKKPAPMYQDDPARSDLSTNRSQRGMDELAGRASDIVLSPLGAISTVPAAGSRCNYLRGNDQLLV